MTGTEENSAKGVWVKTKAQEIRLAIYPITAFEQHSTYQSFLNNNFASLSDGFTLKIGNEAISSCFGCHSDESHLDYGIYNRQDRKIFSLIHGSDPSYEQSADDASSGSEVDVTFDESSFIYLYDENDKLVLRLKLGEENIGKRSMSRVESPPGVLLGYIEKIRNFIKPNSYQAFEASEPLVPSLTFAVSSDFDEQGQEIRHGFFGFVPASKKIYDVISSLEVKETLGFNSIENRQNRKVPIGIIEGSSKRKHVLQEQGFSLQEKEIMCRFTPDIPLRKKVLLLSSLFVILFNGDIS